MNPKHIKSIARVVAVIMLFALLAGLTPGAALPAHAAPGDLTRVSVDSSGAQSNGSSYRGQFSADGRYVAFASDATNLVADDTNNAEDIFVKDRLTGATIRVSLATLTGAQANDGSGNPSISSDGRFVAFESSATNLVASDTNGQSDIFVRDLQSGITTLVSVDSAAVQANDYSEQVSISGDGRFISFHSSATNLVANDTNNAGDVFAHDLQTGLTTRVSVDSSGVEGNRGSFYPQKISANGRYVVFPSGSTNLVSGDTNGVTDIFVHDIQTGQTTRESVNSSGEEVYMLAEDSSISGDGRFVTFSSASTNLLSEDTLMFEHVYIHDRQTGITTLVSRYSAGNPMQGRSDASQISADGRYIAFSHDDRGDSLPDRWIYIHDRISGQTVRATPVGPLRQFLSADGRFLAYDSSNALVPGDTNGQSDVFVKEMAYPPDLSPTVISVQPSCSGSFCRYPSGPIASFRVTFSEFVTGVTVDDFSVTMTGGIFGATVASVSGSSNEYVVNVNTGTGDGALRLDVLDDDSIKDIALNPLGGAGAGNGNFNTGGLYIIDKSLPVITGILRADPNPTVADSVHFTATFSEEVSGVDVSDFTLAVTGNISGATVAEVSGIGNTYAVTVNTGIGDGTLRLDLIDNDSIMDVIANPLGGAGSGNGNFTLGETYTIDKNAPVVISSLRADANPTAAAGVQFIVTFSEAVSGVDAGDFILTTTDSLSGASIVGLSGSANTYTVIAATGTGNGALRLDLMDNDSIVDSVNHPLGGLGAGNGSFTAGEAYTINKFSVTTVSVAFRSTGSGDGWVLESSEDSNLGGSKNSNASIFKLGDDAQDRQFRAILHFPTYYLPDNAVVTQVILMIKKQDVVGTDPFTTHQNISVDIRNGLFGNFTPFSFGTLQPLDFQAPADMVSVGTIQNNPVSNWYWTMLDSRAFPYISLTGGTQIRLAFQLDDNDDLSDDYVRFYSGDYDAQKDRPHLLIEYYAPR